MAIRVAINGFGRIGRNVLRAIAESGRKDIVVVGLNDLGPVETNAHLLRFDSVHGRFPGTVTVDGDSISLGNGKIRVTAVRQGWDAIIGSDGIFVGMNSFGASAPYKELYKHFGITPEAIADAALRKLGKS